MGRTLRVTDPTPRTRHTPAAPVHSAPGDVARLALRLAGGDRRRLEVMADGSVLVRNRPRR